MSVLVNKIFQKAETLRSINLWQIINYGLSFVIFFFALLLLSSKLPIPGNLKTYSVMSGSMEPTIKTGSLVFIKPSSNYEVGEIVTFKNQEKAKETITHRIAEIETKEGERLFTTRGDANLTPDSKKITQGEIVGKVVYKIPYLGYPAAFAKTLPGLLIFIIIPALIIIYDEIFKIHREVLEIKTKRKAK
jgi:signal peptidase